MKYKVSYKKVDRPLFVINLGSTQDPRGTIIGNTHYSKEFGTIFDQSYFVKAIQVPNAIILCDELSRAHPEALNILMTVFDKKQRYLRLDEEINSPTIKVAPGVTFLATANIGNEYTGTRTIDRAISSRFLKLEMDALTKDEEFKLLKFLYPTLSDELLLSYADIAECTRNEVKRADAKISTIISTRESIECTGLSHDGFSLEEAIELVVYPLYSEAGEEDSERTYIKQVVQGYIDKKSTNLFNSTSNKVSKFA